jgi:protein-S-isoprenylcysteine O-methyltransferase Ste14
MTTTGAFWVMEFCLMVILQFEDHPLFSTNVSLKYVGSILLISGLILVYWSLRLLGLKRALCLNFFQQNVPVVRKSLYKYIKNPLDYGIWLALVGFAIFTQSIYNLVIAVEFIIIMISHIALENKPLNKQRLG